eukprot:CAMPEP_0172185372 /NCGR_PEP_ID=MMETSP1050-20130122/20129_1 /TAXON_ID=233186 /ORGANISM="Cryptomonas curvata, Strain CCAP979/52" /LENGTH=169 /DNA_ID=CAMNT_0012859343 /DNA_START=432 /DNA_END=937 /DNA_ORIENTATION=-
MYELKGVISLEDAHIVEMKASQLRVDGHEDRFPFIFKVSSQRSASVKHGQWWILRDYCFAAIDETELKSWVDTLKTVCTASDVELVDSPWAAGLDAQYTVIQARDLVPLSRQLMITTQSNVAHATRKLAEGVHTLFRHIVDGPPPAPPPAPKDARTATWVLGHCHDTGP